MNYSKRRLRDPTIRTILITSTITMLTNTAVSVRVDLDLDMVGDCEVDLVIVVPLAVVDSEVARHLVEDRWEGE